jgi:hypothetical protein
MGLFKPKNDGFPRYDIPDVDQLITQVYGQVDTTKITIFVPAKNEMGLIPAFLAYYRSIGFEQFIWFDDKSDDGTFEYLTSQSDCIVVHASMTFGEKLNYTGRSLENPDTIRFGTFTKIALPHHFLPGKFVAYFDVDEFLLLPPGISHIQEVYDQIDALDSTGAYASVVEFFPTSTAAFDNPLPATFEGLMEAYGWFEPEALFDPTAPLSKKGKPVFTAPSKSMRLFEVYNVSVPPVRKTLREKIYLSSKEKREQQFNRSARHKTPLLRHTPESALFSSHDATVPPKGDILLTIAHFVFTSAFAQKIENARNWKAHAGGGAKYTHYQALLDKMDGVKDGFLSERSMQYHDSRQLIDCGLMKWDVPT